MKPPEKLYQFHVANLRQVDRAMDGVARSLRSALSNSANAGVYFYLRLYALLLGAWAEVRLRKLLYEPSGFDAAERDSVRAKTSQIEQWQKAVDVAFQKQYKTPKAALTDETLPHSAFSRYRTLTEMLENDLRSVIELRNKLAHGQWVYPLNSEGDDIAQEQMDTLRRENLLSLQFKKKLLESLSAAIHDLVISRPTFERDFDKHYQLIVETRRNLKNRDYGVYAESLQQKFKRGRARARAAKT